MRRRQTEGRVLAGGMGDVTLRGEKHRAAAGLGLGPRVWPARPNWLTQGDCPLHTPLRPGVWPAYVCTVDTISSRGVRPDS